MAKQLTDEWQDADDFFAEKMPVYKYFRKSPSDLEGYKILARINGLEFVSDNGLNGYSFIVGKKDLGEDVFPALEWLKAGYELQGLSIEALFIELREGERIGGLAWKK